MRHHIWTDTRLHGVTSHPTPLEYAWHWPAHKLVSSRTFYDRPCFVSQCHILRILFPPSRKRWRSLRRREGKEKNGIHTLIRPKETYVMYYKVMKPRKADPCCTRNSLSRFGKYRSVSFIVRLQLKIPYIQFLLNALRVEGLTPIKVTTVFGCLQKFCDSATISFDRCYLCDAMQFRSSKCRPITRGFGEILKMRNVESTKNSIFHTTFAVYSSWYSIVRNKLSTPKTTSLWRSKF
jgi:hypothetical protein